MTIRLTEQETCESHAPFITVTEGMSGWFAVHMWWNPEMGGFWEPWATGFGRYADRAGAEAEARQWSEMDELEYRA